MHSTAWSLLIGHFYRDLELRKESKALVTTTKTIPVGYFGMRFATVSINTSVASWWYQTRRINDHMPQAYPVEWHKHISEPLC